MTSANINRIGTALPPLDIHAMFVSQPSCARPYQQGESDRVFERMVDRSGNLRDPSRMHCWASHESSSTGDVQILLWARPPAGQLGREGGRERSWPFSYRSFLSKQLFQAALKQTNPLSSFGSYARSSHQFQLLGRKRTPQHLLA